MTLAQNETLNMPQVYDEPGGAIARVGDSSFGVETIDPFTGSLKIVVTDLVIPTNGPLDLAVTRNYQSFQIPQPLEPARSFQAGRTVTGIGWDLHFGRLWKSGLAATQLLATNDNSCRGSGDPGNSGSNPVLELPDGSRRQFTRSDNGVSDYAFISRDRWILRCLPTALDTTSQGGTGNGGAIVISPDGVRYIFNYFHRVTNTTINGFPSGANTDQAYHVTRIEHPNGTYIDVNYEDKTTTYYTELDDVRHSEATSARIDFNYLGTNDPNLTPSPVNNDVHLRSFTHFGTGRTWTFNYVDAIGSGVGNIGPYEYLDNVVRPDGRRTEYEYVSEITSGGRVAGHFSIEKITTPLGGEVSYEYDTVEFETRDQLNQVMSVIDKKVVNRKVSGANSTDTWTYHYDPSTTGSDNYDVTHVSGPTECVTYTHYVGHSVGTVWRVGALESRVVREPNSSPTTTTCNNGSAVLTETNDWVPQQIAVQDLYRPPYSEEDTVTNAARLAERRIVVDGWTFETEFNNPDSYGNPRQIVERGRTINSAGSPANVTRTTNYVYTTNEDEWIIHSVREEEVVNAGTTYATPTSSGVLSDFSLRRIISTAGSRVGLTTAECLLADMPSTMNAAVCTGGVKTEYDYHVGSDNGGALLEVEDANGHLTTYPSYLRDQPQSIVTQIDATNTKTITQVPNVTGTIASYTDGESKTTGYGYDNLNRLTSITTNKTNDNNVTISRTSSGIMRETVTRGTYQEVREYDGFGQLIRQDWSDTATGGADPIYQRFEYDPAGRLIKRFLPNSSNFIRTEYDALGRPIEIVHPGSTDKVAYNYSVGGKVQVTDERGFRTLLGYRAFGDPFDRELVFIQRNRGDTTGSSLTQTTYINRNLIGLVDSIQQEGLTRSFKYDRRFFRFEELHPEVGIVTLTHDNVGNVASRKVGSSGLTTFFYDRSDRLTDINYPDGKNIDFDYYDNDRLRQVSRGSSTWDYLYDENNNLRQEQLTLTVTGTDFPAHRIFRFDYGYDGRDSLSTVDYPSALRIEYEPNAYGRATAVKAKVSGSPATDFATSVSYHPNGQLESFTAGNGVEVNYGQDSRLRLSTYRTSRSLLSGTEMLVDRLHQYDKAGNLTSITDYLNGSNTRSMSYDGLNRLRTTNGPWGAGSISYYANDNIQTRSFGSDSLTYQYNGSTNRLASTTGSSALSFGYDTYGNVTFSGRATYGNYAYDDASLLNLVEDANGTDRISYAHDGNRRTILERILDGSSHRYKAYGMAGVLLYEEDIANSIGKDYIYVSNRLISTRSRCTSAIDSDADGLSNCQEYQNGLDRNNAADAAQDWDGDGLSNAEEIQLGANVYIADIDGDGLSDGYENQYGLNVVVNDSGLDADGDSLTNLEEFQAGTDPTNADTDGDGVPDNLDQDPLFNPALLVPIIYLLLS